MKSSLRRGEGRFDHLRRRHQESKGKPEGSKGAEDCGKASIERELVPGTNSGVSNSLHLYCPRCASHAEQAVHKSNSKRNEGARTSTGEGVSNHKLEQSRGEQTQSTHKVGWSSEDDSGSRCDSVNTEQVDGRGREAQQERSDSERGRIGKSLGQISLGFPASGLQVKSLKLFLGKRILPSTDRGQPLIVENR